MENEGIFELGKLILEDVGIDPWLDPLFDELLLQHKKEWAASGRLSMKERLDQLNAQVHSLSCTRAIQEHLWQIALMERERNEDRRYSEQTRRKIEMDRSAPHSGVVSISATGMRAARDQIRAMQMKVLGTAIEELVDVLEEVDEFPAADEVDPSTSGDSTISAEQLAPIDEEDPKNERVLGLYLQYARHAMRLVDYSEAEGRTAQRVRLVFVLRGANMVEVTEESYNTDFSTFVDVHCSLQETGVTDSEVAWLSLVPLFHAKQWGDRKDPPKLVQQVFAPYVRRAFQIMNAPYLVSDSTYSMDVLQRGLDVDARRPDVMVANLLDDVAVLPGYKPKAMRLEHSFAVSKDAQRSQERKDAIKRLCELITPTRIRRDAFDVLMGRKTMRENTAGGLIWTLANRTALLTFPTGEELAQLIRKRIGVIANLTTRAVKGPNKQAFRGVEEKLTRQMGRALLESVRGLVRTAAGKSIAFICPTGIRECVYWTTALRCYLACTFESAAQCIDWGIRLRGREMPPENTMDLHQFHQICESAVEQEEEDATHMLWLKHRYRVWLVRKSSQVFLLQWISALLEESFPMDERQRLTLEINEIHPVTIKRLTSMRWKRRMSWCADHHQRKRASPAADSPEMEQNKRQRDEDN